MSNGKQDQAPQELADEKLDDVIGAGDGISRLISVTQMKSNDANEDGKAPPPPPPPPPPRRIQ